jgi:hypothetical protein
MQYGTAGLVFFDSSIKTDGILYMLHGGLDWEEFRNWCNLSKSSEVEHGVGDSLLLFLVMEKQDKI